MHLTRKTYARNVISTKLGLPQCLTNRDATTPPPIFRMLLGPADLRGSKWLVFFRSDASTVPRSSIMSARVPPVPTSMPSKLMELSVSGNQQNRVAAYADGRV